MNAVAGALRFPRISRGRPGGGRGGGITPLQVVATCGAGVVLAGVLPAVHLGFRSVLGLAGVVVAGFLFSRHPRWCLVAVIATTLFGLYNTSVTVGPFDLRVPDGPLALAMAWAIHLRVRRGRVARNDVGQLPLAVLLLVFGASLVASYGASPGAFADLLVSFLRAGATFSLAWLVPYTVRTAADRRFVLRGIVLAGAAELGVALFHFVDRGVVGRLRGENGPNAEGLIAVVVLVAILNLPLFRTKVRVLIGVLAVVCLLLTKSISSIGSLMILLGLFGVRATTTRDPRTEALVRPIRFLVLVVGAVLLISTVRPQDIPTRAAFDTSSTASRLSFGYAGIRIFLEHPVLGVGWQRSSRAEVIGSAEVVADVKDRFSGVRPDLLPRGGSITVHNAYVQVLAEGGMVGALVLLVALSRGRRGARAILASVGTEAAVARTIVAELALILMWWNDNAIFGAQPETIMFAVFLGLLASVPIVALSSEGGLGRDQVPRREIPVATR